MSLDPKITKDANGRFWLEWTPDDTAEGYAFTTPRGSSRTFNPNVAKVSLGTGLTEPFTVTVSALDVTVRAGETATYPVVEPPPVPSPEPVSGQSWGCCASVTLTSSSRRREYEDMRAVGATFPRVDGSDRSTQIALIHEFGWTKFVGLVGAFGKMPTPDQCVNYAKANPEAWIEPTNEPCFASPTPTIASVAQAQIACYKAVKAAGLKNPVLMSSVAQAGWSKHPLDVVYELAANGCKLGTGFDIFNVHIYSQNLASFDAWMHVWKPDSNGRSMRKAMGDPPVLVSEFGQPLRDYSSGTTAEKEAKQAQACTATFDYLKSQPSCVGGQWYAMSDDAPPAGGGWGLRRLDLSHRPAWDTYKAGAAS